MSTGRSLELFFVDGRPDGMLTAEVFDWTGHVLRLPRTQLVEGLETAEARQTGVYILLGQDENGPLAYIGETENMADRLRSHAQNRDWWDDAILITAARDALHKAHVKFLEARLIQLAKDAGQIRLENGNQPGGASLNEAHTANMEAFLETLHMVLPAIRVDVFQTGRQHLASSNEKQTGDVLEIPAHSTDAGEHFIIARPHDNIDARAKLVDGKLIVLRGSRVKAEDTGKSSYSSLRSKLFETGVITLRDGKEMFSEDYAFSSPSAAASVVIGRSANGRRNWKLPDGRTYADWEKEQLNEAQP